MKKANKNIGLDAAYAELYAECIRIDVENLFSPTPIEDDSHNWHNPVGNLKDNVVMALNMIEEDYPRSVAAIILRYGLDGGGQRTYDEVGAELEKPVSREQARRLIDKGIRVLRHPRYIRVLSGRVEVSSSDDTSDIHYLIPHVDINKMTNPHDIQAAVGKFVTGVLPKVTVGAIIDDTHVTVRTYNCMARGELTSHAIGEILLTKNDFDFTKIRNCGKKSMDEIRSVIATWASEYLGTVSYKRLVSLIRPFTNEKLLNMTKIFNSLITVPIFKLSVSTVSYKLLTVDYGCDTLFDVVGILNDDNKFMNLCNNQDLYNDVMTVINQHCSSLNISVDQLQTVVKDIDIIWDLYGSIFNAPSSAMVDLHAIVNPTERRHILRNFIATTETTPLDEIGLPASTCLMLVRGLVRTGNTHYLQSVRKSDAVAELLIYNNGIDLTRLRGFGQKKVDNVKNAISKWASKLLGNITYDELVDMLADVARDYIHTELVRRTHALSKSLHSEALRDDFDEHVESSWGRFCTKPVITHDRYLYFSNVLHCSSIYDLIRIDGGLEESDAIRDDDRKIINGLLDAWCKKHDIDRETITKCFQKFEISSNMKRLREIGGTVIHQYFAGPDSDEFKSKYDRCSYGGFKIWEVSDGDMIHMIDRWLSSLTPRAMNRYWQVDGFFKGGDDATQLAWADHATETQGDTGTLLQVQSVFRNKGFMITLEQAAFLWVTYSVKEKRKDWAPLTTDAETWMNIVAYVFTDDMMLKSLKRL